MESKLQHLDRQESSSSNTNTNTTTRDLHPLEAAFKRHLSSRKWPCSRCNQDFDKYKDLYLHMEAGVHVNVKPPDELKFLYEKIERSRGRITWNRVGSTQKRPREYEDDVAIPNSPPPSASADKMSAKVIPKKTTSKTQFVTVSLDCYFCEEMLDSLEELAAHLQTEHGYKKAICFVENCYASFDKWDDHKKHVTEGHIESDFFCSKCPSRKLTTYNGFKSHLYEKHWTGIFRCPLVPEDCSFEDQLLREPVSNHFKKFHKI